MAYVWLDTTTGMRRFVDDQFLSSCNHCGKPVGECRKADCYKNPYELKPYLPTNMTKENEDEQPNA